MVAMAWLPAPPWSTTRTESTPGVGPATYRPAGSMLASESPETEYSYPPSPPKACIWTRSPVTTSAKAGNTAVGWVLDQVKLTTRRGRRAATGVSLSKSWSWSRVA